jgi:hypothetical protein
MRTTVTLAPDVRALVERRMAEQGLTFGEALNGALRSALAPREEDQGTPTFSMGEPSVPVEKALRLAAELEDDELARRLSVRT